MVADASPAAHTPQCFALRTVRVCVAFGLRVSVAVLLELTELAKPVERPSLRCNTLRSVEVLLRLTELVKPVEMPGLCCNLH